MLSGKVALITGASRGIGKAIALEMAKKGADIAVIYAGGQAAAQTLCEELFALGVKSIAYQCDVRDFEKTKQTVAQVKKDFGKVDILVNNAGIAKDGLIFSMNEEDFDSVLDTNLKGAFHLIKHCYPIFLRQKSGKIINISSIAGLIGNAGQANYSASKAGLIGLTKSTARELAGRGICCNAIAPGFIETDMTANLGEENELMKHIPLGRMGKAEEVAQLAAFLASSAADYITGEIIRVDGGLAM